MKRHILLASALISAALAMQAQQSINVISGNVAYSFNAANTGVMSYGADNTVSILGNQFNLADIDKIAVKDIVIDDNTVLVEYSGENALVSIAGNLTDYVAAKVTGANVSITQSENVTEKTCGEITYILKGNSDNGSLTLNGSYKASLELQGLTLTNPNGAAIDIQNGKRISFSSKNGTVNTLTDGENGSQKAALYCKGHLELKGKGTLNVIGRTGHAISAKEYVEMKNCTVNIEGAVKDGINCTQYFLMESGSLKISGIDGDGIQVDYKDIEGERDEEDTGSLAIEGGTVDITISGTAAKGFKTEGNFTISGGEVTILTSGAGEWDDKKLKTKASSCIGVDGNAYIKGGKMTLTATGGGGKGISCDGNFVMDAGDLDITTNGGALVYRNGQLNQNYTGNLDNIASDYKSSPKGIKADSDLEINGGTIYVKTTGTNGEGIESKNILTINDGDITVRSKDDGINSSSHMYINGGRINVIATSNDGLDSNGNLYIRGGEIMSFGAGSPECGIDANEEQGYTVIITGGYLLAAGGNNSVPSNSSGSTQAYVTTNGSISGGTDIAIASGSETLHTFTVPADYTSSSNGNGPGGGPGGWGWGFGGGMGSGSNQIMISTPEMVSGQSYKVTNGSSTSTATARTTGGNGGRPW